MLFHQSSEQILYFPMYLCWSWYPSSSWLEAGADDLSIYIMLIWKDGYVIDMSLIFLWMICNFLDQWWLFCGICLIKWYWIVVEWFLKLIDRSSNAFIFLVAENAFALWSPPWKRRRLRIAIWTVVWKISLSFGLSSRICDMHAFSCLQEQLLYLRPMDRVLT